MYSDCLRQIDHTQTIIGGGSSNLNNEGWEVFAYDRTPAEEKSI